jgi:hypothetical protein
MAIKKIKKPRVGIVGEILVKFHPIANNKLVSSLEKEGADAYKHKYLEETLKSKIISLITSITSGYSVLVVSRNAFLMIMLILMVKFISGYDKYSNYLYIPLGIIFNFDLMMSECLEIKSRI